MDDRTSFGGTSPSLVRRQHILSHNIHNKRSYYVIDIDLKMMKLCLLLLTYLALLLPPQECHGTPLVGRPRRRLTDVVVDDDIDAGKVDAMTTCDGQLSQSVVQLKQQVAQLQQDYNGALETLQRLEQQEKGQQHAAVEMELSEAMKAKDEEIEKLKEHIQFMDQEQKRLLQESGGDVQQQQQELTDQLTKVQEEAHAREAAWKDQLDQQAQEMAQLLETTKQEAEKELTESVTAMEEEMKKVKGQSAAQIAQTQDALKELQSKNQQKDMETKKLIQLQKDLEQVSGRFRFFIVCTTQSMMLPTC